MIPRLRVRVSPQPPREKLAKSEPWTVFSSLLDQPGNTKGGGEVSLYRWPPAWLVWISLFCKLKQNLSVVLQLIPNQSNRRSTVQWYFPCLVFPGSIFKSFPGQVIESGIWVIFYPYGPFRLSVIMLNVIVLSVIMLTVMAPTQSGFTSVCRWLQIWS